MTSPLIDLVERCEQATGPDRALDLAIALHALGRRVGVRKFTASLDSAMTLVPEGWCVSFHSHDDDSRASVYRDDRARDFSYAATPALALCAAVLRARYLSLKEGEGGE